jgi:NAD(P)-dependent dehydrogenase (short-subunit alcohol dehydrogenase family)
VIVARGEEELFKARDEMKKAGGKCYAYTGRPRRHEALRPLVAKVLKDHGGVDILINNAGRSIRRSIELSYDRFHDFERTMQLNYFGCLRLIMGLLPKMTERRAATSSTSRRSACWPIRRASRPTSPRRRRWMPSRRCAQGELSDKGISFTTINMPLVKTPMIAPTKMYDSVPTLSPEEAAT